MTQKEFLIEEIERELQNTRKAIEMIPFEKKDFKPHEKSFSLLELSMHALSIVEYLENIASADSIDFARLTKPQVSSTEALLSIFDSFTQKGVAAVKEFPEEDFSKLWEAKYAGNTITTMPKSHAFRYMFLNHLIHHRGQISVYLRMVDAVVPGLYGPSADEK